MAGLLYLPKFLFIMQTPKMIPKEIFTVMEKRLYNFIMMPAMGLSGYSNYTYSFIRSLGLSELWMQIKIVAVLLLTHYHFYLRKYLRLLSTGENSKSSKFFKIINEIPTVLLIVIVFVVVFKPL